MTIGPALDTELRVEEELELGRSAEGAGNLAGDAELSRRHALIRREGGKFVIHDLGSMNGTFVNGQQLDAPYAVSVGDTIEVGGTRLLVRTIEVEATPVAPDPEPEPEPSAEPPPPEPSPPAAVPTPEPEPASPARLSLRIEIDFEAGEATVTLDEGAEGVRLVHERDRWRIAGW